MTITALSMNTANIPYASNTAVSEIKQEVKIEKLSDEDYVKKYYSDVPVLAEVARCESHFRQHDSKGNLLRGESNQFDVGLMQINEMYHSEKADKLGYDLKTREGNVAYARYIFDHDGLKPWKASSACWGRTQAYSDFITNRLLAYNSN